jgi:organic hydroperoxide reductase OsmC/OhrA
MADEEHRYIISSRWVKEKIVTIESDGKKNFQVATPLDFWPESPIDIVSPEELFVASAVSCYGVSLSGISRRFHAELKDFRVTGTGTLQKGEFGWEFDQITIEANIIVPTQNDKKKMEKVAERAHTYCVVANSMKCPVHLKYEISVE